MAVTYNTTLKNTRMSAVFAAIDAGAGNGTLEIGTSGMASVLATITLAKPSASVSGGVMTFLGTPLSATAAATGTAAEARIKESGGTAIITGLTVGTSGTNIIISSTSITSGQTVQMTSGTITHG